MEYNTPMALTLGQQLRQIREAQGISLEEIAQKTHIKIPYLKALEEGDSHALPSRTQMRGFLRLYASVLGVNLEDLQASAEEPLIEQDETRAPDEAETLETVEEEPDPQPTAPSEEPSVSPDTVEPSGVASSAAQPELASPPPPESPTADLTAAEIFTALGQQLQQRRDLLSLSLENVESQIHIRQRFLSAIEAGHFDQLPSPVQARGMLANYAEFLNLDVDALLLAYAEGLQKKRLENMAQPPEKRAAQQLSPTRLRLKNFFSLDLLVIALIFLIFAGFVVWGVNRILSADSPEIAATDLPGVSDVLLATGSATPDLLLTEDGTVTPGTTGENAEEVEATPIFTAAANNSAINVVVIPLQSAWVQVTSDGEVAYEGRLLSGNAYDYFAENRLELLTGSAGALQVYFNDQDIGSIGLVGQVSNLVFTEDGLLLPTATPTPPPTVTPQNSATPTLTPSSTPTAPEDDATNP